MPLVVMLHGYSFLGAQEEAYLQVQKVAEERGFLYVHPDGTLNALGDPFWNATDACCGFGSKVDDSAYLTSVIDQVSAKYSVDPKRIFFIGHSNGGFMTYRMACDHADRIAAVAVLAGATFDDPSKCNPSKPVSVVHVHGDADGTIAYTGGSILGNTFPSAVKSVTTWAGYDGCATTPVATGRTMDIAENLPGKETTVTAFDGCPAGIAVELWTMKGGPHIPAILGTDPLVERMIDFLFAHPKA